MCFLRLVFRVRGKFFEHLTGDIADHFLLAGGREAMAAELQTAVHILGAHCFVFMNGTDGMESQTKV